MLNTPFLSVIPPVTTLLSTEVKIVTVAYSKGSLPSESIIFPNTLN